MSIMYPTCINDYIHTLCKLILTKRPQMRLIISILLLGKLKFGGSLEPCPGAQILGKW